MEQFDRLIKEMAEKEEMIVPNGFDERISGVLDNLPPPAKKGLSTVKMVMIAAAVCAALLCTAFAASPGLRGMLAKALGSFAPYAQEQEDKTYTMDGFELKVLSAMADDFTVRVYTQAMDLTGKGRLDIQGDTWLGAAPWLEILVPVSEDSIANTGGSGHTGFDHYDPETQTAMLVTTAWRRAGGSLSGAVLKVDSIKKLKNDPNAESAVIPLEIKAVPTKTLVTFSNKYLFERQVEELRLSPLSLTVIIRKADVLPQVSFDIGFSLHLKDGSIIEVDRDGSSGHSFYKTSDGNEHEALTFMLADPLDSDQVVGIDMNGEYFPVN